jgi:hypothetical protein
VPEILVPYISAKYLNNNFVEEEIPSMFEEFIRNHFCVALPVIIFYEKPNGGFSKSTIVKSKSANGCGAGLYSFIKMISLLKVSFEQASG